jgi:hypothetical protein
MQANFLLGALVITPAAQQKLNRTPMDLLARHAINDHGRITRKERQANELGMQTCGPIVSRYRIDPTSTLSSYVVIRTSAGWDETLVDLE